MNLRDRIIAHEGLRLKVYKDSLGFDTIGVGRLLSRGINKDEAMLMLDNDIANAKSDLLNNFPEINNLDEARLGVLIEMVFQLGINRFSLFKNMLSAITNNDYEKAADEMLNSAWHTQTPSRVEELSKIMRDGIL